MEQQDSFQHEITSQQQIFNDTKGIVIVRNIISEEEQLKLIDIVNRKGELHKDNGEWNFFGMRGRHFCNIDDYPPDDMQYIKALTTRFKTCVESVDDSLAFPQVTHLLTLLYPDTKGMGWHTDSYGGNDGDEGAPVYSLTLGNSCIFEWKLVGDKQKVNRCTLGSGDIIVFGGEQRLMYHRVKNILKGSFDK